MMMDLIPAAAAFELYSKKPLAIPALTVLVTIPRATVSCGSYSERYAIQVARTPSTDVWYGVSSVDGLGPNYIYNKLTDEERLPVPRLQPVHLDHIIAGIILEGFGEKILPSLARNMNLSLYEELRHKLHPHFG